MEVHDLLSPDDGDEIAPSNVDSYVGGAVIPIATYSLRWVRHWIRLTVVIV